MYKIEKTAYGLKLVFGGFIEAEEMLKWLRDSENAVKSTGKKFSVLVDMRELKPLPTDSQKLMEQGQRMYKEAGMERSAVILSNHVTTMQFKRLAKESGIYQWERYIDASKTPDWEAKGQNWITKGIDPD